MISKITRRGALFAGLTAMGALASCETSADVGPTMRPAELLDPSTALSRGRGLAEDVMKELRAAFEGIEWEDAPPVGSCAEIPGGSRVRVGTWKSTRERWGLRSNKEEVRRALAYACTKHDLPAPKTPEVGTGGWLNTESRGRGLRLEFREKGYVNITVTAFVTGSCADVNDDGR